MAKLKVIQTNKAPKAIGPYSQAVKIGNLIFTAGQIPLTPAGKLIQGSIKEQTRQVFENLKAVLKAAGSSLNNALKVTVYMTDLKKFSDMNEIYKQYFSRNYPARSTVQVANLPKGVNIEVDVVAYGGK